MAIVVGPLIAGKLPNYGTIPHIPGIEHANPCLGEREPVSNYEPLLSKMGLTG